MPRIKAASVAEHVAEQERAVFAAAIELFIERGYDNVTLSDIAATIGLARNSLYRYFPDKAHILVRWFEQELPDQVQRATAILNAPGTPVERITAWSLDQLSYARRPEHNLAAQISSLIPNLDAEARTQLASAHEQLSAPLHAVLAEAGIPDEQRALVAGLLQGVVLATARYATTVVAPRTADALLAKAVRGILGA
jgi:AcrR family transcriptional regulator